MIHCGKKQLSEDEKGGIVLSAGKRAIISSGEELFQCTEVSNKSIFNRIIKWIISELTHERRQWVVTITNMLPILGQ